MKTEKIGKYNVEINFCKQQNLHLISYDSNDVGVFISNKNLPDAKNEFIDTMKFYEVYGKYL